MAAIVLLVEDDSIAREILTELLVESGVTVFAFGSAEDAAAFVGGADEEVGLLVTDVLLPGRSGVDLALDLRSRSPETKVLFISGYCGHREISLIGSDPLLRKPFDGDDFVAAVVLAAGAAR